MRDSNRYVSSSLAELHIAYEGDRYDLPTAQNMANLQKKYSAIKADFSLVEFENSQNMLASAQKISAGPNFDAATPYYWGYSEQKFVEYTIEEFDEGSWPKGEPEFLDETVAELEKTVRDFKERENEYYEGLREFDELGSAYIRETPVSEELARLKCTINSIVESLLDNPLVMVRDSVFVYENDKFRLATIREKWDYYKDTTLHREKPQGIIIKSRSEIWEILKNLQSEYAGLLQQELGQAVNEKSSLITSIGRRVIENT